MYSPLTIAAAEATVAAKTGITLHRTPPALARANAEALATLWDPKAGALSRPLLPDERDFVFHERLLAAIDARYFLERYAMVNKGAQRLEPLAPLWVSQELVIRALAEIERKQIEEGYQDGCFATILKARQLGCCLDPATRVLTADLRWVPIDQIQPGMELVAVDEDIPGGRGAGRTMCTTKVEARADVYDDAFEVQFTDDTTITATGDHRFLYRTETNCETEWRRVKAMRPKAWIRYITTPWEPPTMEDAWFGGLLDGEGSLSCKASKGAELNVSQVAGAVFDRAERYLRGRGYAVRIEVDQAQRPSKFGSRPVNKLCVSRMNEVFQLMGQTRPTRFLQRRWWEDKNLPGKRTGQAWKQIRSVRAVGHRRMVDLQTTAKTFIAEGLVSHNSTLTEALLVHRFVTRPYSKLLIASDVATSSAGLFTMAELLYRSLPWYLKPAATKYVTAGEHRIIALDTESILEMQSGKAMRGQLTEESGESKGELGRSQTYSGVHLSELATWEHPEQLDSALFPTIPIAPYTFGVLESTAKGRHNWWHQQWKLSERGMGSVHKFAAVFIPWYAEPTKWRLRPPPLWTPSVATLEHARRCEANSARWLGHAVTLTRDQLYWYEGARASAEEKEDLSHFLAEYPAEPEDCFQFSGRSIFPLALRERIKAQARPLSQMLLVESAAMAQERAQLFRDTTAGTP